MRRTMAARVVAQALLANPDDRHWGYSLSKQADVPSGVLYPILARMEREGWLASAWEMPDGARMERRYYQLTDDGREHLPAFLKGASK
jgi:PadR family transcriptional regulator PadR